MSRNKQLWFASDGCWNNSLGRMMIRRFEESRNNTIKSKQWRKRIQTVAFLSVAFLSLSDSLLSSASISAARWMGHRRMDPYSLLFATTSSTKESNNNEEPQSFVSDAEALLACYSFLNKRKRLGNWTQLERRKLMKASAQPHFFWEELEDVEAAAAAAAAEEEGDEAMDLDEPRQDRNENKDEIWYGEFTSFPTEPTITRVRRSQAAKRTWQDPEFRKKWYERRWKSAARKEDKEKHFTNQIRALPADFLSSPGLSSMTEDEIEHAIQTYVNSRKKRVESRKKTLEQRKALLVEPKSNERLPRDSLFNMDEAALKEAQRKRSERAKKLYQTRLRNKRDEVAKSTKSAQKTPLPDLATPPDALARVQASLDQGAVPAVEDIRIVMEPSRLPKRKALLRSILSQVFDLRGRCVPTNLDDTDSEKEFVTQSTVGTLGAFVIQLLEERDTSSKL